MGNLRQGDRPLLAVQRAGVQLGLRELSRTVFIMLLTTVAAFIVRPARGEVSGALIFVLGIIWAGATLGLGAALIAASASFLLYNFYFAEPILMFRLDTLDDFAPLIIFNISAILAGLLAGRLRDQAEAAADASHALRTLFRLSSALQSAVSLQDIRAALVGHDAEAAGVRLFPKRETWKPPSTDSPTVELTARVEELDVEGLNLGLGAYRIECAGEALEFIVAPDKDQLRSVSAFSAALINLVTLAIERAALTQRIAESETLARTEGLKSSLLSSVSHDFRTPLATISASASSLLEYGDRLDPDAVADLLRKILAETERLNRFTANLLEMTKLEAGQISTGQILAVWDVVGTAIGRVRGRAGGRNIERTGLQGCFVFADASLFELALVNVLENAVLYSADGTRIRATISASSDTCLIEIADEGRGIPASDLDRIFERFYRVDGAEQMPRGSGLGLAITRSFVSAFGGSVEAVVPGLGGRGSMIRITLPVAHQDVI